MAPHMEIAAATVAAASRSVAHRIVRLLEPPSPACPACPLNREEADPLSGDVAAFSPSQAASSGRASKCTACAASTSTAPPTGPTRRTLLIQRRAAGDASGKVDDRAALAAEADIICSVEHESIDETAKASTCG
ncbi:hypothetical protein [Paenibacillus kobensis]|uniref:hypothetical protein n=1 Tax=Paenibacillus kobensis TaxID=59841 RepID=UPI000FD7CA82|nr:hypothetical protein [Paenibacillus kobensis]